MSKDLKRALFIGVGGSGGTTLRFLWRELELRLAERGWDQGMPAAWQFLHIDVAQKPDGISGSVPRALVDPEHFFGIAREPLDMSAYLNMIPVSSPEVLAGWSPSPKGSYGSLWLGAGQRRAVGRVVAMTQLSAIHSRIESMRTAMASDISGIQGVAKAFGAEADTTSDPYVYLISSLGGGSGSGIFLDISMLLETMKIEHASVLYGPDVFDDRMRDTGMGRNSAKFAITGNALGALAELVSAHEHEDEFSSADSAVLALSGSNNVATGRRTGKTHFFIGRKGMGKFELPDENAVFHATARALTAITVNGDITELMSNYVIQNADSLLPSATSLVAEPNKLRDENIQAAMSFGYAAVTTGRQSFSMYAAERLTRKLMDKLADDDAAIKKLRERENETFVEKARHFAEQCGLRELKDGPSQVSDALRGGVIARTTELTKSIVQSVVDHWEKNEFTKMKPSQVGKRIETDFGGAQSEATATFKDQLLARAHTWSTSVQALVLQNVVTSISRNGMGMTIAYLDQMELDLSASIDEARGRVTFNRNLIGGLMAQAEQALAVLDQKVRLVVGSKEVSNDLDGRRKALAHDFEGHVVSMTAELIDDLVHNLLKPLKQELKRSRTKFEVDKERTDVKKEWSDWATGPVPKRLQPAENEVFLETTDTFASSFEAALQDSLNADTPAHALDLAVGEVLAGLFPGLETSPSELANARLASLDERFALQTRIVVNSRWVPTWSSIVSELWGAGEDQRGRSLEEPSVGGFDMDLELDELLRGAKLWTRARVGFRNFSQVTLYQYLYEPIPEAADRCAKFAAALSEAFQKAALMVRIDADLLQAFAGVTEIGRVTEVTPLPVLLEEENGKRTSEGEDIMNILTGLGGFEGPEAEAHFDSKSIARVVEIVCLTSQRVHPFALGSVVTPIAQAWAQASLSPGDQAQFWQLRRSRSLTSFIPLAPSVQLRMAKGWVVARLLNYITQETLERFKDSHGESELTIFDPSTPGDGLLHFPRGLLDAGDPKVPITSDVAFPAVIESLPLAYLALANGSSEELKAYTRLADLGAVDGMNELSHWIRTGELPLLLGRDACPVTAKAEWAQLSDLDLRAGAVLETLQARRERHRQYADLVPSMAELGRLDRAWEFRDEIDQAITDIEEYVAAIKSRAGTSGTGKTDVD